MLIARSNLYLLFMISPPTLHFQAKRSESQDRLTRLNILLGYDKLSLEEKLRRAIRAAKFEETPKATWLKILPTIPEGVSTTRSNEMFCWARSMILDRELGTGISQSDALKNTVECLFNSNVY